MIKTRYFDLYTYVQELKEDDGEFMTWFRAQFPKKFTTLVGYSMDGAWNSDYQMNDIVAIKVLDWAIDIRQLTKSYRGTGKDISLFELAKNLEDLVDRGRNNPPNIIFMAEKKLYVIEAE